MDSNADQASICCQVWAISLPTHHESLPAYSKMLGDLEGCWRRGKWPAQPPVYSLTDREQHLTHQVSHLSMGSYAPVVLPAKDSFVLGPWPWSVPLPILYVPLGDVLGHSSGFNGCLLQISESSILKWLF